MNSKQKKYSRLRQQLQVILKDSPSQIAKLSSINAVLFHKMPSFSWVGFYFVEDNLLSVGPYQGPLACQILKKPNGVCWKAVQMKEIIIVDNVHEFEGHIACDSRTNSEIVFPLFDENEEVWAVLDIDSYNEKNFDHIDAEEISLLLKEL